MFCIANIFWKAKRFIIMKFEYQKTFLDNELKMDDNDLVNQQVTCQKTASH